MPPEPPKDDSVAEYVVVPSSGFQVGTEVSCFAGSGIITSIDASGAKPIYCVTLGNWVLAYGSTVKCFLQEEAMTRKSKFAPGDYVKCYLGCGKVLEVTDSSRVKLELQNWELAYSNKVTAYLAESQLTLLANPIYTNLTVGQKVACYAGSGTVTSIEDGTNVSVLLNNWELAYGSKVTCHLNEKQLTVIDEFPVVYKFPIGTKVVTQFGKGIVTGTRSDAAGKNNYIVTLHKDTWELAYGQKPTLYLAEEMLAQEDFKNTLPSGGEHVKTPFGDGYVLSTRANGVKIVESGEWKLAGGSCARMFLEGGLVVKA